MKLPRTVIEMQWKPNNKVKQWNKPNHFSQNLQEHSEFFSTRNLALCMCPPLQWKQELFLLWTQFNREIIKEKYLCFHHRWRYIQSAKFLEGKKKQPSGSHHTFPILISVYSLQTFVWRKRNGWDIIFYNFKLDPTWWNVCVFNEYS